MRSRQMIVILTGVLVGLAAPSGAQTYVTPFAGAAFGGSTDDARFTFGGNLAFAGSGPFGVSVDAGYTKDFFGAGSGSRNNVTTLMGNLMLISPRNPRLYASAGAGLLRTRVEDLGGFFDANRNAWGMNAGVGFYVFGEGGIGFRGDLRYFRRLTDPEPDGEFDLDFGSLRFWRGTAGLVLRF